MSVPEKNKVNKKLANTEEGCENVRSKVKQKTKAKCLQKTNDGSTREDDKESGQDSFTDFICPICLQLLIKPVVLPCRHELCMPCFEQHISETSRQCPMCRKRISVWARRKKKEGSFIDEKRWALIQKLFPERCRRRLNGEEDLDESLPYTTHAPVIAGSGEIREEYEKEMEKIREERQKEVLASEEVVRQLQEEEQRHANFYSQQEKEDKDLALMLQREEINQTSGAVTSLSEAEREILSTLGQSEERCVRHRDNTPLSSAQEQNRITNKYCADKKGLELSSSTASLPITSPSSSKEKGTKENIQLSKWFSKKDALGGFSNKAVNPFSKLQEDQDRDFALKLQHHFDAEGRSLPKTTLRDFYPLRDRMQNCTKRRKLK